jgi:hypothetical protein
MQERETPIPQHKLIEHILTDTTINTITISSITPVVRVFVQQVHRVFAQLLGAHQLVDIT